MTSHSQPLAGIDERLLQLPSVYILAVHRHGQVAVSAVQRVHYLLAHYANED